MGYQFDFGALAAYIPVILHGVLITAELTLFGTMLGVAVSVLCAWGRSNGPAWLRAPIAVYVELIRNTPFIIQLFFIFFGLPSLGLRLSAIDASILAMVINLGAYGTEIVRAGITATPRGQKEAGASLGLTGPQIFWHIVLIPALSRIWPALSGQVVIVMLGSAVCSQISVQELTYAASYIQSRSFRAFEAYFAVTALYLILALALRQGLRLGGKRLFPGARAK
jgi:polar amino acid transport system permease protein